MGIWVILSSCCGWSKEERQTTETAEVVPSIPPSLAPPRFEQREEVLLHAPNVEGVPLIPQPEYVELVQSIPLQQRGEVLLHAPNVEGVPLIPLSQYEPPQFDRREQVLLDSNGANDAFLNPRRHENVFAFVIECETASHVATYLRDSPRFPRLTYFRLELFNSSSHAAGGHLYLSEFLQRHRDTLTFLDIDYEDIEGSEGICNELRQAVPQLEQLTTLRIPGSDEMIALFQWTLPELRCLEIIFPTANHNDFAVLAPNLETCHISDNCYDRFRLYTVDLTKCQKLVKVSFFAAEGRKLILPKRGSQVKWLNLGSSVNITGDLSQLLVLEIFCVANVDVNPLLDACKLSLLELCLTGGQRVEIDATTRLRVLRLSSVQNARVLTTASAHLELLTASDSSFSENQEPLYAKRVWLSSSRDEHRAGNLSLKETVYLGAHMASSRTWNSDFEAVVRGLASTLRVFAISPMLAFPSFQTLQYVCLPTIADFLREKERLGNQLKAIAVSSERSDIALRQLIDTVCPNVEWIPSQPGHNAEFDLKRRLYNYFTSHAIYVTNTARYELI